MSLRRVLRAVVVGVGAIVLASALALGVLLVVVSPPVADFDPEGWRPGPGFGVDRRSSVNATAVTVDAPYGPEDIAVDRSGVVYTGDRHGMIRRIRPDGSIEAFADVGGRPLGLAFDRRGNLIVANHGRGLQAVDPDGRVRLLADEAAGRPILFANDLVIDSVGAVWFSDSSFRYNTATLGDVPSYLVPDLVDGRAAGRLLRYDARTGLTEQVLDGLYFPNGVALTADETAVWIAESTRYRILRYSIGERRTDVLVDDVPGVPDGLNRDADGSILVALYDRTPALDDLILSTALGRHVMIRLPNSLFVNEDDPLTGAILVLEATGVVRRLHTGLDPAATNVVPHEGRWYLGALLTHPVRSTAAR
ncbi:SMP-30/gluconolactonase/LRE family protein [Kribbella swartbergensis]